MNSEGAWASAKSVRVLVADDDPIIRNLIRVKLSLIAHEVVEAADGREAWELLYNQPFQLALVDLSMPNLDGLSLIQCVRTHPRTRHMPIVVITSRDDQDSLRKALEAGASSYMTKPLTWSMFNAHVQHLLRLSTSAEMAERALQRGQALAATSRSLAACLIESISDATVDGPARHDLARRMSAVLDVIGEAEVEAPTFSPLGEAAKHARARVEKACPGGSVAIDEDCDGISIDCSAAVLKYLLSELFSIALAPADQDVRLSARICDDGLSLETRSTRRIAAVSPDLEHQLVPVRLVIQAHGGTLECSPGTGAMSMTWPGHRVASDGGNVQDHRPAHRLAV